MTYRKLTDEERAENSSFIMNADGWPMWPMLPVKRRVEGRYPECAMVTDRTVNLANSEPALPLRVERDGGEVLEYATVDAMLDDGWIVD